MWSEISKENCLWSLYLNIDCSNTSIFWAFLFIKDSEFDYKLMSWCPYWCDSLRIDEANQHASIMPIIWIKATLIPTVISTDALLPTRCFILIRHPSWMKKIRNQDNKKICLRMICIKISYLIIFINVIRWVLFTIVSYRINKV